MAESPADPNGTPAEPAREAATEAAAAAPIETAPGLVLRGTGVTPGLALGRVHRKDHELSNALRERVPLEGVENELNRFHRALLDARAQLAQLKERLVGKVQPHDARILDVHVAYLKDSVFISDVENLILTEQLCLEAAIAKVISDFDRIFRLVQNQTLRERAVDLRDVGIRVLRQLDPGAADASATSANAPTAAQTDYVLVAPELSIVDMFNLRGERVLGILTEGGGLTSHAAVLARSMRIPTLTGVRGLLESVREGDFVIVDASEGLVRINPDERVRAQYLEAQRELAQEAEDDAGATAAVEGRTKDGERVVVSASCGSLPEVSQAASSGLASIGLYRTELLYLVDKEPPTRETLSRHYAAVLSGARGAPVAFRLLHADSSLGLSYVHASRELNPALGRSGVRALLSREEVLRRQLQAILRATEGGAVTILVPFVTDVGEVRRVKEILFEERLELKKSEEPFRERVSIGVVLETPASILLARSLARECDHVVLALDAAVQHLLAADRENTEVSAWFETLHPCVLRALTEVVQACEDQGKPLALFGALALRPHNLPFLLGLGLRNFIVPPSMAREFQRELGQIDLRQARRDARTAAKGTCQAETLSLVDGYRHGYAR